MIQKCTILRHRQTFCHAMCEEIATGLKKQGRREYMNDILTYIKNNNADFNEAPFNRVDALILSWLSYFTYPDYLKSGEAVALKDLKARGLLPDAEMYLEAFRPKTSKKFFELLTISGRFRNLELSDYRAEKDETEEKQFAAVCMKLQNDVYYL